MPFWINFWSIFNPNLVPTWLPKSSEIHEKPMPRCLPIMTSFFVRFLIDFQLHFRSAESSKSLFSLWKNKVFQNIAFRSWNRFLMRLWCQLGSILPSQIHQNRLKIRPQEPSKFWSIFASIFFRFGLRFGHQVGAMLATLFEPRRPKDGHKTPQGRSQDAQRRPKTRPRRPQGAQDPPQTTILEGFWGHIERFGADFWKAFGKNFLSNMPPQTYFPRAAWSPNKLARRYQGVAFLNICTWT